MAIDCIIATHRRPELLRRALASVASQTVLPARIIVADDAADEATRNVVMQFSGATLIDVTYIPCPPDSGQIGTAGRTRNSGAAVSTSSTIAFLDDDDEWEPEFLSASLSEIDGHDIVLAPTRHIRGDWSGPGLTPVRVWTASSVISKNPGLTGSNFVISRGLFEQVGGFDVALRVANDWDFAIRCFDAGARVVVLRAALVRQHAHNDGQLTARTEARAKGLEAFGALYRGRMTRKDQRELRRIVHSIRRVSAPNRRARMWHLMMQVISDSPRRVLSAVWKRVTGAPTVYR